MPQYFISRSQINDDRCIITGADFHHISAVRRAKPGDKLSLRCDTGELFETEILKIKSDCIEAAIISALPSADTGFELTLCTAIIKGGATDDIVRRATETGVSRIIPMITERAVTGTRDRMNEKLDRWRRIASEASKQCLRSGIPLLGDVEEFKELVSRMSGVKLVAHTGAAARLMEIERPTDGRAAIFIGPEGGFSPAEILAAESAGAIPVCFGRSCMRAETAGSVIPAIIIHDWGYSWT